jgi:hypothetical protein
MLPERESMMRTVTTLPSLIETAALPGAWWGHVHHHAVT